MELTIDHITEIQGLYNKEFTFNMFENLACEIVRDRTAYDLFFKMYQLKVSTCGKNILIDNENKQLQLFFRVNGRQSSNWVLEGFNGKTKFNMFADKQCSTKATLLKWERATSNGYIRPNVRLRVSKNRLCLLQNIFK